MALFGEKYGDIVRMVTVGCGATTLNASASTAPTVTETLPDETPRAESFCSRELCGGTHVKRTGEIGMFRIVGESSVGSGLRRIEAVTGRGAEEFVDSQVTLLRDLAQRLQTTPAQLAERADQLLAQIKQQQQQLTQLQRQQSGSQLQQMLETRAQLNGFGLVVSKVDAPNMDKLREMGDWLRDKLGSGVVVLGTVVNDKPQLLAMVSADLVKQGYHAGNLVKALAAIVGGGGGGRPDTATAGGRDVTKLDAALAQVGALLAGQKQ
jgi:alanyl-tRNA synthetase